MQKLHFKTNAYLKNVLGQELINDDNVAVQELVKNSYDAGSKSVEIIFKNLKQNKDSTLNNSNREKLVGEASKILVIDKGSGMTTDDIVNKWLNIAYSSKKDEKTKHGRVQAGAKGVGRFSCDRLGEFLDLYTKTRKDNKIIHLLINWNEFEERHGVNDIIQNIDVYLGEELTSAQLNKKIGYTIEDSGTILEISKLRSTWIEDEGKGQQYNRIIMLKHALEKLTNPNQKIEKEGFRIYLQIEDLSKKDFDLDNASNKERYLYIKKSLVENKIFENLNFRTTYIESELSEGIIKTTLKYRDNIIFEIKEKNTYDLLQSVHIKIKLHFLNQYSKSYFKKYTGTRSFDFGSIFLFINGFRIIPYGDFGNDWLGLEVRKGQGRARYLGARDLVGWFEIDDQSGSFIIISNREGLVKNKNYEELVGGTPNSFIKSYFYSVFRKLELFVVDGLDWDRIYKTKASEFLEEDEKAEIRDFMKDFEAEISSNNWKYDPSKERYAESTHEKNLRILKQIFKIITTGTKKKDIISLYINEEVISDIAGENLDFIKSIVEKIDEFDNVDFATRTSKGIANVRKVLTKLEEAQKEAERKQKKAEEKAEKAESQRKQAEAKAEQAQKKQKEAEDRADTAEKKQKQAETENIFLKSTNLQDKEQITSLFHHIGIHSDTIKSHSTRMLKNLNDVKNVPDSIYKHIESITTLSQMVNTIAKIGFKGGITEQMEKGKQDIIQFTSEFVKNICTLYYETVDIQVENTITRKYVREFSPFEMTYVIDNFISNSKKQNATKILFKLYERGNKAIIEVIDDGDGLSKSIKNIEDIFSRNVSTTRGAGLGLYDAKKILSKMEVTIQAENIEKGFKIIMEINQ
jgi:signal transduction histidine kinase